MESEARQPKGTRATARTTEPDATTGEESPRFNTLLKRSVPNRSKSARIGEGTSANRREGRESQAGHGGDPTRGAGRAKRETSSTDSERRPMAEVTLALLLFSPEGTD